MADKVALITGITGQDGSYLAEFLLEKGYVVHGIKRRASSFNTQRIDHVYQDPHVENAKFTLHYGDLSDSSNLIRIVQETQPDEIYNLGAQSHVAVSFESPEYTADVDAIGTLRLLEAIRILEWRKRRGFTKQAQANFTDLCKKHRNAKQRHFIHAAPMPWQSSMLIGFASIFARHTAFMPAMVYCSTMKAQGAVKPSSLAKSHAAFQTSPAVSSNASTWEILMHCAIGAMRAIMFGCSG